MTIAAYATPVYEEWKAKCPLRVWLDNQPQGALQDLSVALYVDRQMVYHWLAGNSTPTLGKFLDLSKITGISIDAWVTWERAAPKQIVKQRKNLNKDLKRKKVKADEGHSASRAVR